MRARKLRQATDSSAGARSQGWRNATVVTCRMRQNVELTSLALEPLPAAEGGGCLTGFTDLPGRAEAYSWRQIW